MKVFIQTYGCTANQNNSEIISGILNRNGFEITNKIENADIIIIGICVVKLPTIKKIEFKYPKKKMILTGCIPKQMVRRLQFLAPEAAIIDSHHIKYILKVIRHLLEWKKDVLVSYEKEIKLCQPKNKRNKLIGITQICEGCFGHCSFCLTRIAKGKLYSYPIRKILKNVDNDAISGCKEIWITSQDNASYGLDYKKRDLANLLKRILKLNHRIKIRIGMMNPTNVKYILKDLIEVYKKKEIFKFLHIPVQSGSDKILKLMGRTGNVKEFLKVIKEFREQIPEITISTDIIVGFPEETDNDFRETINLIKKIKPDILNISKYWAMPNTDAAKMKQIPVEISKKRASELMKLHAKIALENNQKLIGKEYDVLVDEKGFENTWLSRNENYKLIIIRSDKNLLGKQLKIRSTEAKSHYLIGE